MKTTIGITEDNRKEVSIRLNKVLADEYLLYKKTKKAHWIVEVPDFHSKQQFYETQFEQLDKILDGLAERMRSLEHYAFGTRSDFSSNIHMSGATQLPNVSLEFIRELLKDHDRIIDLLRGNIAPFAICYGDLGISDFITGLMEKYENMA